MPRKALNFKSATKTEKRGRKPKPLSEKLRDLMKNEPPADDEVYEDTADNKELEISNEIIDISGDKLKKEDIDNIIKSEIKQLQEEFKSQIEDQKKMSKAEKDEYKNQIDELKESLKKSQTQYKDAIKNSHVEVAKRLRAHGMMI